MNDIYEETQEPNIEEEQTSENQEIENEEIQETEEPKSQEVDIKSILTQKEHWRDKAKKAEAERVALEAKLNALQKSGGKSLDVEDYIDISASLKDLDQQEQEWLSEEHKFTGKSLKDIRSSEKFKLLQSAYRDKLEKDKLTLAPSSTQAEIDRPKSLSEKLATANTIKEKEKILSELGLYKSPRPRSDRVDIGNAR